ncbi:MAG: hypothetical protein AB7U61_07140 [Methylocystis sp.]
MMLMEIDEAARLGGSRGLMQEGEPQGIEKWPAAAQLAFAESYSRGRLCRRVAEGKTTLAYGEASIPVGATREQLVARFNADEALQREFATVAAFIAYAQAESAGKVKRIVGRVVSR